MKGIQLIKPKLCKPQQPDAGKRHSTKNPINGWKDIASRLPPIPILQKETNRTNYLDYNEITQHEGKMFNIQAPEIAHAKSPLDKCFRIVKLIGKILLRKGMSAHVYDYSYSPSPRDWDSLPSGNVYEKIISRNKDVYFESFVSG